MVVVGADMQKVPVFVFKCLFFQVTKKIRHNFTKIPECADMPCATTEMSLFVCLFVCICESESGLSF